VVLCEPPQRLRTLLEEAAVVLGRERPAAATRELTKMHQEIRRGSLGSLAEETPEQVRGEVTVVIRGASPPGPDVASLAERVNALVDGGLSRKEAAARIADESGAPKRALYDASLER
jgi:16S rRNA (cytidine1402-2'-O)-methyltransferase